MGGDWKPVGGPVQRPFGAKVNTMCVFDDGTGPALFAGGFFFEVGGVAAHRIARWGGMSWSALGAGVDARIDTLSVAPGHAGGRALFMGGAFTLTSAGDPYIARDQ